MGQALSFLHDALEPINRIRDLSSTWSSSRVSRWKGERSSNIWKLNNVIEMSLLQAGYRRYCDYPKCDKIAPPGRSFKKCLKCKDLKIGGIGRYCGSSCQGEENWFSYRFCQNFLVIIPFKDTLISDGHFFSEKDWILRHKIFHLSVESFSRREQEKNQQTLSIVAKNKLPTASIKPFQHTL